MPIYEFKCNKCGDVFELLMGYDDPRPKRCKVCRGKIVQKFSLSSIKVDGTYKTLGALADANAAKMTEEQKDQAIEKIRTKKPRPTNTRKPLHEAETNFPSIKARDEYIRKNAAMLNKNFKKK